MAEVIKALVTEQARPRCYLERRRVLARVALGTIEVQRGGSASFSDDGAGEARWSSAAWARGHPVFWGRGDVKAKVEGPGWGQ